MVLLTDFAGREMTREEVGCFYEIVLERHGKKPNIITSARSPEECQALFPDLSWATRPLIGLPVLPIRYAWKVLLLENRIDLIRFMIYYY